MLTVSIRVSPFFTEEDALELFGKAYELSKKGPGDNFYDSVSEKAEQNGLSLDYSIIVIDQDQTFCPAQIC